MTQRRTKLSEVCEIFSVSDSCVRGWVEDGCPVKRQGGKKPLLFDAGEVAAWLKANPGRGTPGRPREHADSPDLEAARLRKENALASKYELQVQRERKELVPLTQVKEWLGQRIQTAKGKLLGLGAGVAPQCESQDAATIETIINGRVRDILHELATGLAVDFGMDPTAAPDPEPVGGAIPNPSGGSQ